MILNKNTRKQVVVGTILKDKALTIKVLQVEPYIKRGCHVGDIVTYEIVESAISLLPVGKVSSRTMRQLYGMEVLR